MDKRIKIISDNFDTMKIGLDEKFSFQCIMCGGCCINREDIILSPQDIYRMAKELNIMVQQLFIKWQHTILRLNCFLKEEEKTASSWGMEVIWKVACIELYLKYNLERDFYTQFEENIRELFELLQITSKDKGGEQNE